MSTLRLINTAEVYANRAKGNFVPLADLVSTGALQRVADMNEEFSSTFHQLALQNGPGLLEGFDLALVVNSEGSSYKLSLVEKRECGTAYFTDDHGIIYLGKAMGCP